MSLQRYITGLTIFTALVHLFLALSSLFSGENQALAVLFLLNFIGYVFLLAILVFIAESVKSRTLLGIMLAIYSFITILAYGLVNYDGQISDLISPLGLVTKLAEIILIIMIYKYLRSFEQETSTEQID